MYALVKTGKGKYYGSIVFGHYKDSITETDEYKRYIKDIHSHYYVVFDPEKKCLRKWYALQRDTKYLIPTIIIVDSDKSGWTSNSDETGGVDFLPKDVADTIIESGNIPNEIYEKCIQLENNYTYNEYPEIKTQNDINDLLFATGCFHDGRIVEIRHTYDDCLYVKFDGMWGCSVEIWFRGDVSYDVTSRDPETCDPYWYDSTVIIQDEFIYLIDDENMTPEKITDGYCWFKARHMQYHIIPN